RSVRTAVADALDDPDVPARVAALRLVLASKVKVSDAALRKALEDPSPEHRIGLLASVEPKKEDVTDLRLVGVVSNAVVDDNGGVRFEAKTSPEYQVLLDCINGARLKPSGEPAASR